MTGLSVRRGGDVSTTVVKTSVWFRQLTDGEIARYITTGEPMDKAGAYGIQGLAGLFVERLDGDYFSVMGLPVCALGEMLQSCGVTLV